MTFLLAAWATVKPFLSSLFAFFSKPPGSWIGAAIIIIIGLWWFGQHEFNRGRAACEDDVRARGAVIVERQAKINVQIGDIIAQKISLINQETQTFHEEVPKHVTPEIDHAYPIPLGFVRVFNAASHGPVPGPSSGSDADPSGVPLSDVAHAHVTDEGTLDQCRAYLTAWWDWYDQQKAAWDKR